MYSSRWGSRTLQSFRLRSSFTVTKRIQRWICNPVLSHLFRFWLWLTTVIVTKEWVAVHRKHHAKVESDEDPHSPQVHGINAVLWGGLILYRRGARTPGILDAYGKGTPDDWLERHLYAKRSNYGITALLLINLALFGIGPGLAIWVTQMLWIPFWAAGVINGIGHFFGYRNYELPDESRNIVPWGVIIGGEELHNNHHAFAGSGTVLDSTVGSRSWLAVHSVAGFNRHDQSTSKIARAILQLRKRRHRF